MDVYYAAFVVPDTIFQLLVIGSLSAAFIPVFTKNLEQNEKQAWDMAASSLNLVLLVFTTLSVVIFIFAPQLSKLIAPGFDSSQIAIMASLLRVMLVAQLFFSVSGFLTGMIQSHQRFFVPALAPIVYNLGIIIGIVFLSPVIGIMGPAVGVVIGAVLHMAIQIPAAYHLGFRFSTKLDISNPGVREIVRLMPPRALALGIDQIEQLVAVILASLLAPGSLSLLNVARLLYSVPASLFGVTIGQAALPTLSKQSNDKDKTLFLKTLTETLTQVAFLALPMSVLFIILRVPIVRIVFGSRSFPWTATILTGKTLAILALSATFSAVMQLIIRGFYALHDTKTPLIIGLLAAILDTFLGVIAVKVFNFGILGLAGSIAATAILETLILYFLLIRLLRVDYNVKSSHFWPLVKMLVISLITGISLWIPMHLLDQFVFDTTRTVPLLALTIITGFIGAGVYMLLSYIFDIPELYAYIAVIKKITNWRQLINSNLQTTVPEQN